MTYPESGTVAGTGAGQADGDLAAFGIADLIEIGRGATSSVYAGRQERYARDVAVKVFFTPLLDEAGRRRFERECRTLGRLSNHPSVVNLYGSGFDGGGRPFIVMDLCRGGSLLQTLTRSGPMTVRDVLRIGVNMGSALAYAHSNHVLHRDIKPGNILLSEFGAPVLSDFGISDEAQHEMSWTIGASLTPLYAAPEVLENGGGSPASDLWSLAATLYALLLGDAPFGDTSASLVSVIKHITHEPPRPIQRADVPAPLVALLGACLEKDPERRPPGPGAFARSLQQVQRDFGFEITQYLELRETLPPPTPASDTVPEPAQASASPQAPAAPVAGDTDASLDATIVPGRPSPASPPAPPAPVTAGFASLPPSAPSPSLPAGNATVIRTPLEPAAPIVPVTTPRSHRRWLYAAAAVVVVGGAIGGVLATSGSTNHDAVPPVHLAALTAPAMHLTCTGLTCRVAGTAPAAGDSVQVDFGDHGSAAVFTGSTISHRYRKAGSYEISATTVNGTRSSSATTLPVVLHAWQRSVRLSASSRTSHHLTLKIRSASRRCLASRYQLQTRGSRHWLNVGKPHATSSKGVAHLHVNAPGRYRAEVARSEVSGGTCAASNASTTVHSRPASSGTSVATPTVSAPTTHYPTTTTHKSNPPSRVPVQPTFAPPPK